MIISKSIRYFRDKVRIEKREHTKAAHKIQFYNNAKIDGLVESYAMGNPSRPTEAMLFADLAVLNKPEVYKNYNRIINSKYTKADNINNILLKKKADGELNRVVELEVERIAKNMDYVESILKRWEVPLNEYNKRLDEQADRSLAKRQEIIRSVAIQANELVASEGLNIPQGYSYRNLDSIAESLIRSSKKVAEHEKILEINKKYTDEGKSAPYVEKVWIHTGEAPTGVTRHMSNHGQHRSIEATFLIQNDDNGDLDEMMHPLDPNGSPSNAMYCYCDVDYRTTDNSTLFPLDL